MKRPVFIFITLALVFSFSGLTAQSFAKPQGQAQESGDIVTLGKAIFFDPNLSVNGTQSCASCHAPEAGFSGPEAFVNAGPAIYQGALPNRFGDRKPPAASYAGDSPILHYDADKARWFGGMFWDGRATGWTLGDPLAEQAQGPFLNPLEQAIANPQVLCLKVKKAAYANLFEEVWGAGSLNCARDVKGVYEKIGRSVAAYERSNEVNPFTSKFDRFWDNAQAAGKDVTKIQCPGNGMGCGMPGMGGGGGGMGGGGGGMGNWPNRWTNYRNLGLSDVELIGLAMFNDPNRANCASCHSLKPGPQGRPLFTDFGYDNLGIPKNPENPFYAMPAAWNPDGADWVDPGLSGFLKSAGLPYDSELGKHKVPTMRNVDLRPSEDFVKAYGHNGYFKSLEDIVFFYHWRAAMDSGCMNGGCEGMGEGCGEMGGGMGGCEGMATMFPEPELDRNRVVMDMFPRMQVDNLVAFLKTLSDGYFERQQQ